MTDVSDFIEHYGTKGMKWGVRRAAKKEHREWLKGAKSAETGTRVFNEAAKTFNPVMKKINNSPQFKGKDLNADHNLRQQYDAVVGTIFNQHLAQASGNLTYNAKTERAVVYQFDRHSGLMRATEVKRVSHADGVDGFPDFKVTLDTKGFVVKTEISESSMAQSDILGEFLSHYGVKGMRWGKRGSASKAGRSEDAARAYNAVDKAKKKGVKTLSNHEMQILTKRLELEKKYSDLSNPKKEHAITKGHNQVKAALAIGATLNAAYAFSKTPIGQQVMDVIIPRPAGSHWKVPNVTKLH